MRWPSRPLRYPPETAVAAEVLVSMALRTDELSVVPMALIQKHHEAIIQPVGGHIITMELAADNNSATNGTIAGVLNTDLLIDDFAKIAGAFDPSLCPPSPTFESIATQLRQASDIGADGSQDPAKTCDGISIGLGFEMEKVDLGSVAPAVVPPDPCAE